MINVKEIEMALESLKNGKIIVVSDSKDRENEGDLICSAEFATRENINFMATYGKGLICMPMSEFFVEKFQLEPMTVENTDNHNTAFTVSIDHVKTKTGISAAERSITAMEFVKESAKPQDFRRPGHMFPLKARKNGVLSRAGHTEATVDLCRLAGLKECGLCCEIMANDGNMMCGDELSRFCDRFDLKHITIEQLIEYRKLNETLINRVSAVKFPTEHGVFDLYGYTYIVNNESAVALVKGSVKNEEGVLCRIHSECLTGDVFGSLKCDCGEQLERSMKTIEQKGKGIIIYLRQEGRGIGLINKLRAYHLQEQGLDTSEANIALGFEEDLREYFLAAQILKDLDINKVKLLTNNMSKVKGLEKYGIEVLQRVPIRVNPNIYNKEYLKTKKNKMGHIL